MVGFQFSFMENFSPWSAALHVILKDLLQVKPRIVIQIQKDPCSFFHSWNDNKVPLLLPCVHVKRFVIQWTATLMIYLEYSVDVSIYLAIRVRMILSSPFIYLPRGFIMIMPPMTPFRVAIKLPNGPPWALLWTCCHFVRKKKPPLSIIHVLLSVSFHPFITRGT